MFGIFRYFLRFLIFQHFLYFEIFDIFRTFSIFDIFYIVQTFPPQIFWTFQEFDILNIIEVWQNMLIFLKEMFWYFLLYFIAYIFFNYPNDRRKSYFYFCFSALEHIQILIFHLFRFFTFRNFHPWFRLKCVMNG